MPADIENMVLTRERAWHDWPVLQTEPLTFDEVIANVPQIGAEVRPRTLYWRDSHGQLQTVEGHVANIRDAIDGGAEKLLGVVTDSYELAQTRQLAAILDSLVAAGELKYETAMSLDGGKRHAILARLPEDVKIAGDVIEPFIFGANSFNASQAASLALTNVRIVCSNTLRWGLQDAEKRGSIWRVRHTGSVNDRLAEAAEALGFAKSYIEALRVKGERYSDLKMTPGRIETFLKRLVPMPTPDVVQASKDGGASKVMRAGEVREVIRQIVETAPDLAAHKANGWGWLNGVVEYEDHYRQAKTSEARTMRIALGERTLIEQADRVLAGMLS